jgi:hypothetical protein
MQPYSLPPIVPQLGYAGLLPFAALALGGWALPLEYRADCLRALVTYGAVIVTFLGAVHWGVALAQNNRNSLVFVWGVMPSIVAWCATLLPAQHGGLVLSISLIICWVVDRRLLQREAFAASYLRLRTRLTFAAWAALVVGRLSLTAAVS